METDKRKSQFSALLGIGFRALLAGSNLGRANRRKAAAGIGAAALLAVVMLYISGVYSYLFATLLSPLGALDVMLNLMLGLGSMFMVFFTMFSAQGVLFGSRDTDLLFALPVTPVSILASKVMAVYLENLLISLFFTLPAGVVYLLFAGQGGAAFLLILLCGSLFLPLLPTLVSLLLGYGIAAVSSRMGNKRLASLLVSLLMMGLLFYFIFTLNGRLNAMLTNLEQIRAAVATWLPHISLLVNAARQGAPLGLVWSVLIGALPFFLGTWLLSRNYLKILSRLNSHTLRQDYRVDKLQTTGQTMALLKKEAGRYFGSSIYALNTGFGLVLMLLSCLYLCFARNSVDGLLLELGLGRDMLLTGATGLFTLFLSTTCTTGCSISLEGEKYLWIIKTAPISTWRIFGAKIGFNLLLGLPVLLVSCLLVFVAGGVSPLQWGGLLLVLLPASALCFSACFGLLVNLSFPKLDALNDTVVVKQSLSAMLSLMLPMLLAIGLVFLYTSCMERISFLAFAVWAMLGYLALAGLCLWWLGTKGKARFQRLY